MPTVDDIEYDVEMLKKMGTDALLYQLIARKDLEHPKRERKLQLYAFEITLRTACDEIVNKLKELRLFDFANDVGAMIDEQFSQATLEEVIDGA